MRRILPIAIGIIAATLLLWGFWELAEGLAGSPRLLAFDQTLSGAVRTLRVSWLTAAMMLITFLGDSVVVVTGLAVVAFWLVGKGRRRDGAYAVAIVAVGTSLAHTMKGLFERPRPELEHALIRLPSSFSFPSGHTMGSMCLAWVVVYALIGSEMPSRRKAMLIFLAICYALLVAFSRVYLGVHWPSDVVASWLLGGSWIALATGVYSSIRMGRA